MQDGKDAGWIPGSGISPGGGNGKLLQYSCLKNSMDRGDWWATDNEVAESDMIERLSMPPVPGFPGRGPRRRGYKRVCHPPLLLPLTSDLEGFKQRDLSGWQETSVFLSLAAEPIQSAPTGWELLSWPIPA